MPACFAMMALRFGWQSETLIYVFCGGMSGGLTVVVGQGHVIERWWVVRWALFGATT